MTHIKTNFKINKMIKTKFILILIAMLPLIVAGQSLEELKLEKSRLLEAEKYGEIAEIQEQIDLAEFEESKKDGTYLKMIESKTDLAIKQENYAEAQSLKEKKALYLKIVSEDSLCKSYVTKNDFSQAEDHKIKRDQYTYELLGLKKKSSSTNTTVYKKAEILNESKPQGSISFKDRVMVNSGVTFGAVNFKTSNVQPIEVKYTPKINVLIGLDYKFNEVNEFFYLETGSTISILDCKLKESDYNSRMDLSAIYLGTHLYGNYKLPSSKLTLTFGPFLDIGILGTQKIKDGETYKMFSGNDTQTEAPFKRLNLGLSFKASVQTDVIKSIDDFYLSYRLGLSNTENTEAPSGVEQSTKTWMLCIGVRSKLRGFKLF